MTIENEKLPVLEKPVGRWARVRRAVDERLGLSALRYPVPRHANNVAWTLGGLTLAAVAILIVTGIILAQFYSPTPEAARESVLHIETEVGLGSLLRGIHVWAAQVGFFIVFSSGVDDLLVGYPTAALLIFGGIWVLGKD